MRGFARIIENGHLQRGYKPVHWCLDCGSALAEAEVEYQDKTSAAIDVRFAVVDPHALAERLGIAADDVPAGVPIWTTTAWTLPANQAVALGPELDYGLSNSRCGVPQAPGAGQRTGEQCAGPLRRDRRAALVRISRARSGRAAAAASVLRPPGAGDHRRLRHARGGYRRRAHRARARHRRFRRRRAQRLAAG